MNLVVFYGMVKALVNMGRTTDVIYLNLCKTFTTVLHDNLVFKLATWIWQMECVLDKELVGWMHSKSCSQWLDVQVETRHSIPRESVLGLELLNILVGDVDSGTE